MRTSVIIPNYNYASYIAGAIQSVLNQTEKVDEIIVVDDGSTDNSRDVIQGFGDKIKWIFQENKGQAAAISAGFAEATGDIIALLDSDDFFVPDKIKIIKSLYQKDETTNWIFHDLEEVEGEVIPQLSHLDIDDNQLKIIDQRKSMYDGVISYDAPATSGLSFRRSFIADLFPLPLANSIFISDHYIKFYCLAMSAGMHLSQNLGGQLIHGNNLYTGQKQMATRGKIFANTAYALRLKCPDMVSFCDSLMAEGHACAGATETSDAIRTIVDAYKAELPPLELLVMEVKTLIKTRRYKKQNKA